MKKWVSKIKDYWWVILICLLIIYVVTVSILNLPCLNRVTKDTLDYLNLLVPPIGVILGLILGYPLLKRKLVDGYITRQFEIVHENNRVLKKECLRLREKYPVKPSQNSLTKEHIEEALADIRKLNEMAIDANPDAFRYTQLLYDTLLKFNEKTTNDIVKNFNEIYYFETLSTFISNHLNEVYKYSKSIGFIPNTNKIIKKPIVIKELSKYVTDNERYEIQNIDTSLKHASAMLVVFYAINNAVLSFRNPLLLKCCYLSIPTPSPLARLLFNKKLYLPLVLRHKGKNPFNIELVLIKFVNHEIHNIDDGTIKYEIEGIYANITSVGFVEGSIKDKNSLNEYKDVYLDDSTFDFSKIIYFDKYGENINFKFETKVAQEYFYKNEKKIRNRIKKEL